MIDKFAKEKTEFTIIFSLSFKIQVSYIESAITWQRKKFSLSPWFSLGFLRLLVTLSSCFATMVDEVSRLAMTLAISESGRVSFGAAGAAAFSSHSYAVGRLMSSKKKIVPKLSWQQWPHFWDLKGKLQIRAQGERYVMRFDDRKAGNILLKEDRGFTVRQCFP